jgi:hypothetical protein
MAHKTPTKRVVDVRLTVLDGGSIPPISTRLPEVPVSSGISGFLLPIGSHCGSLLFPMQQLFGFYGLRTELVPRLKQAFTEGIDRSALQRFVGVAVDVQRRGDFAMAQYGGHDQRMHIAS